MRLALAHWQSPSSDRKSIAPPTSPGGGTSRDLFSPRAATPGAFAAGSLSSSVAKRKRGLAYDFNLLTLKLRSTEIKYMELLQFIAFNEVAPEV